MLTGLLPPTAGAMTVFGRDVGTDLAAVRRDLGVCPQHDVLWPELTVSEHLTLFAAIKGVPPGLVAGEVDKAVREVGLTEKRQTQSSKLSGGQKRKLSVAIALIGGSKVVVLDEPTSGMDPYSRRSTWEALQNARAGRVTILTTHFMDEADLLGDRIAIMAQGQVRCAGSPMFLKKLYGVGYVLTIVKQQHQGAAGGDRSESIIALLRGFVPEVAVATNVGAELGLRLPLSSSALFPAMFGALDERAKELGVSSYVSAPGQGRLTYLSVQQQKHTVLRMAYSWPAFFPQNGIPPSLIAGHQRDHHGGRLPQGGSQRGGRPAAAGAGGSCSGRRRTGPQQGIPH